MPPRRSTRVAVAAERTATALAPLPPALAARIFALLPADVRLRARAVCRAWRAALSDAALWFDVDLSWEARVRRATTDALLRAVCACAGGRLRSLNMSQVVRRFTMPALLEVAAANTASLRELRLCDSEALSFADVEALLAAAPHLTLLAAHVICTPAEALRMMRAQPPFGPVRLHEATLKPTEDGTMVEAAELAEALPAHPSLRSLSLLDAWLDGPGAAEAILGAAHSLPALHLFGCRLTPAAMPEVTRLLRSDGKLASLTLTERLLLNAAGGAELAAALAANRTLGYLSLCGMGLWREGLAPTAAALLAALTGHPTLRTLSLCVNRTDGAASSAAAGAALAALLDADSPVLEELDVSYCEFDDVALAPLFGALARNTHLRKLDICRNGTLSQECARDALLPAARACASLQTLTVREAKDYATRLPPAAEQASALVANRAARQQAHAARWVDA